MYEELFAKVEAAIDAHPGLRRINEENPVLSEPQLRIGRFGCSIHVYVKRIGGRSRNPDKIWAEGDTPEKAVDALIEALDYWAQVI